MRQKTFSQTIGFGISYEFSPLIETSSLVFCEKNEKTLC